MSSKFKNLIQEFRSKSTRSVQLHPVDTKISLKQESSWANSLPSELLREVLMRVEGSGLSWPARRSLVACAGVCRSWREIVKDFVRTPEFSGFITFPVGVKQPGPRDCLVQCFIKRNRSTQTYILYLNLSNALTDDGKFLLAARKCRRPTYTDYIISLRSDEMCKGSSTYVGKLRSNFLGSKFIIFDGQPPHPGVNLTKSYSTRLINSKQVSPRVPALAGIFPVGHILYESNVTGSRGPRRINCIMDAIPASSIQPGGVAPTQTEISVSNVDFFPSLPFFRSRSSRVEDYGPLASKKDGALVLRNKAPRWHEELQCWCLNFHGRVTIASVKNFQLVASPENGTVWPHHDKVILQFGKVGRDLFTMDYCYPISAFQAFAICLSSFDTKIACE